MFSFNVFEVINMFPSDLDLYMRHTVSIQGKVLIFFFMDVKLATTI